MPKTLAPLSEALKQAIKIRGRKKVQASTDPAENDVLRLRAYKYLVEDSMSVSTIAKKMGYTRQAVASWVNHEYERTRTGISHYAAIVREQQSEQYDKLIAHWWDKAVHPDLIVKGEKYGKNGELKYISIEAWEASVRATDIVLKAMEQKAKLFGLSTVKVEHGGKIEGGGANNLFLIVQQLANKVKPGVIEGDFTVAPAAPTLELEAATG